jgi:hypothetical protein
MLGIHITQDAMEVLQMRRTRMVLAATCIGLLALVPVAGEAKTKGHASPATVTAMLQAMPAGMVTQTADGVQSGSNSRYPA